MWRVAEVLQYIVILMDKEKKLFADEVLCLQMAGLSTSEILHMDIEGFERLHAKNREFEEYLNRANALLDRQEERGIVTFTVQDADFPGRLLSIGDDCPPLIYCLGNLNLLRCKNAVAIIGARACDRQGYDAAYEVAKNYATGGNVIVSGLALGCDTAAHRGALAVEGFTIAVVATGLNLTHPEENRQLQADILSHEGLLLSEQPFGVKANPTRLVARNRLQAALSEAVILAQCPAKSGSLHTMRFARQYHRRCLAVEFPVETPVNAGNFNLIASRQALPIRI